MSPQAIIRTVRQHLIWVLLSAYVLAALLPGPGNALRGWGLGELPFSGGVLNPTHLLLGILLFCVGMSIRPGDTAGLWRVRSSVLWSLLGGWIVPLLALGLFAAAAPFVLSTATWSAFLLGAAVVIAMPPANSASVWSQMSGGSAATTLTVIILGSLICPLLTPTVLTLVASSSGPVELRPHELFASLEVLVAFVVLPAAFGVAVRALVEALFGERCQPFLVVMHGVSIVALLVLNYANAAAAELKLMTDQFPVESVLVSALTVALCGVAFTLALGVSRFLPATDRGRRLAFVYVTGMKNTGVAFVLSTSVFALHPLAVLVPMFYTISQHLAAALADRWVSAPPRHPLFPVQRLTPRTHQASTTTY